MEHQNGQWPHSCDGGGTGGNSGADNINNLNSNTPQYPNYECSADSAEHQSPIPDPHPLNICECIDPTGPICCAARRTRIYRSTGTITKVDTMCGIVNDNIFFFRDACEGFDPRKGDCVYFVANYVPSSSKLQWNATTIRLLMRGPPQNPRPPPSSCARRASPPPTSCSRKMSPQSSRRRMSPSSGRRSPQAESELNCGVCRKYDKPPSCPKDTMRTYPTSPSHCGFDPSKEISASRPQSPCPGGGCPRCKQASQHSCPLEAHPRYAPPPTQRQCPPPAASQSYHMDTRSRCGASEPQHTADSCPRPEPSNNGNSCARPQTTFPMPPKQNKSQEYGNCKCEERKGGAERTPLLRNEFPEDAVYNSGGKADATGRDANGRDGNGRDGNGRDANGRAGTTSRETTGLNVRYSTFRTGNRKSRASEYGLGLGHETSTIRKSTIRSGGTGGALFGPGHEWHRKSHMAAEELIEERSRNLRQSFANRKSQAEMARLSRKSMLEEEERLRREREAKEAAEGGSCVMSQKGLRTGEERVLSKVRGRDGEFGKAESQEPPCPCEAPELEYAIIDECSMTGKIPKDKQTQLQEAINEAVARTVVKCVDCTPEIHIESSNFDNDVYTITLASEECVETLRSIVESMSAVWNGCRLHLVPRSTVTKWTKATFFVKAESVKRTCDNILKIIGGQNRDLNVELWELFHREERCDGDVFVVAIDQNSAKALQKNGGWAFYLTTKIYFNMDPPFNQPVGCSAPAAAPVEASCSLGTEKSGAGHKKVNSKRLSCCSATLDPSKIDDDTYPPTFDDANQTCDNSCTNPPTADDTNRPPSVNSEGSSLPPEVFVANDES